MAAPGMLRAPVPAPTPTPTPSPAIALHTFCTGTFLICSSILRTARHHAPTPLHQCKQRQTQTTNFSPPTPLSPFRAQNFTVTTRATDTTGRLLSYQDGTLDTPRLCGSNEIPSPAMYGRNTTM